MRKRIVVIIGVFLLLSGCNQLTNKEVEKKTTLFKVVIDVKNTETAIVPNPQNTSEEAVVVLRDFDLLEGKDELCMADLSFVGIEGEAKITSFAVGCVTSIDSSFAQIRYSFSEGSREKKHTILGMHDKDVVGNCLVLSASTKPSEIESDDSKHYIIVLDYANKKSYMTETSLLSTWSHSPELMLTDITGDGLSDIVVSNVLNGYRSGASCEILRFDVDNLKRIYSNTNKEDNYFSGNLIDNYKAIIKCKEVGFSKKVSLLDIGYDVHDLEIGKAPSDSTEDETHFCRSYQNKKLQKDKLLTDIYAAALDDAHGIQCYSNGNMKSGIKFLYRIYMGKWNEIGSAYAYMQYNKSTDIVEIVAASFEHRRF